MRKTSIYVLAAGVAALTVAVPSAALAQDDAPGGSPVEEESLTAEQQAIFDTWPPDRQLAYGTWPKSTKSYFWSLSDSRQDLFWRLTDDDKIRLTAMAPEEQEAAWAELESRAAAEPEAPGDAPPVM